VENVSLASIYSHFLETLVVSFLQRKPPPLQAGNVKPHGQIPPGTGGFIRGRLRCPPSTVARSQYCETAIQSFHNFVIRRVSSICAMPIGVSQNRICPTDSAFRGWDPDGVGKDLAVVLVWSKICIDMNPQLLLNRACCEATAEDQLCCSTLIGALEGIWITS